MRKVIKFKLYNLLSNRLLWAMAILIFLMLNFSAIANSGVLFSGGREINAEIKYTLLINNYTITTSFYSLILAVFLGASTIGPDRTSGNIYILLSAYPSRIKYFLSIYLTACLYLFVLQVGLFANSFLMYYIFEVDYVASDLMRVFVELFLNSMVIMTITAFASVFLKGYKSVIVGLAAYSFFSIYSYNEIPFINETLLFDVTRYKDVLCNFVPVSNVLAPSITDIGVMEYYKITPIIPNLQVYQCVFIIVMLCIACVMFDKVELK